MAALYRTRSMRAFERKRSYIVMVEGRGWARLLAYFRALHRLQAGTWKFFKSGDVWLAEVLKQQSGAGDIRAQRSAIAKVLRHLRRQARAA